MKKGKATKRLKGHITISKVSGETQFVEIRVGDRKSGIEFLELRMSLEEFAKAVTGQGYVDAEFLLRGTDKVGKVMEMKDLVFEVPDGYKESREAAEKNCQKEADKGWEADGYYNSQGSFRKHDDGKYYAHGTQRRWVDKESQE